MSFTETTTQSWGGRLMESIKGVLTGVALFLVSFVLLFMNESCAVKSYQHNKDATKNAVVSDADTIDPAQDGKLIHINGEARTSETLKDPDFAVSANAIHLVRSVEMYQWQEDEKKTTKKNMGGSETTTTEYTYKQVWSDSLIDSSGFKQKDGHTNPSTFPVQEHKMTAEVVTLGAYRLPKTLINELSGGKTLTLTNAALEGLAPAVKQRARIETGNIYIAAPLLAVQATGANGGTVTATATATTSGPQIGDVRVSFTTVEPKTVTVQAMQKGEELMGFVGKTGTILRMESGALTIEQFSDVVKGQIATRTWILRLVGFLMMAMGVGLVFAPLAVFGDVIPFIGGLMRSGIFLVAVAVALPLSLITIAISWVVVRPLVGIPLLLLAIGSIVAAIVMNKKGKSAAPAAA